MIILLTNITRFLNFYVFMIFFCSVPPRSTFISIYYRFYIDFFLHYRGILFRINLNGYDYSPLVGDNRTQNFSSLIYFRTHDCSLYSSYIKKLIKCLQSIFYKTWIRWLTSSNVSHFINIKRVKIREHDY